MPSLRQIRGKNFEDLVEAFLIRNNFTLVARNIRIPLTSPRPRARKGVEIDLLVEDREGHIWVLEAKGHCNAAQRQGALLSREQYRRILGAVAFLRHAYPGRQVSWALVWRKPSGDIEFAENPCYF